MVHLKYFGFQVKKLLIIIIIINQKNRIFLPSSFLDRNFIELCKKNIPKGQDNVKLTCCDVEDYSFPTGSLTVFLFNPFDRKRLENLVSKLKETNSNCLIIYFNPKYYDVFKKNKLVRELKWQNFGLFEEKCHFYRY